MGGCCCCVRRDGQRVQLEGWATRLAVALPVQTLVTMSSSYVMYYTASDLDVLSAMWKWRPHAVVAFLELLAQSPKVNRLVVQLDARDAEANVAFVDERRPPRACVALVAC